MWVTSAPFVKVNALEYALMTFLFLHKPPCHNFTYRNKWLFFFFNHVIPSPYPDFPVISWDSPFFLRDILTVHQTSLSLESYFLDNISVRISCYKVQLFWLFWGFSESLQVKCPAQHLLEKSPQRAVVVVMISSLQTWDLATVAVESRASAPVQVFSTLKRYSTCEPSTGRFIAFFTFESQN